MCEKTKLKVIGIRPGEKLHEVMCPSDDSHLTIEFKSHFVIMPTISFVNKINYMINNLGEKGKRVKDGFQYNSKNNSVFLSVQQIKKLNKKVMSEDVSL